MYSVIMHSTNTSDCVPLLSQQNIQLVWWYLLSTFQLSTRGVRGASLCFHHVEFIVPHIVIMLKNLSQLQNNGSVM